MIANQMFVLAGLQYSFLLRFFLHRQSLKTIADGAAHLKSEPRQARSSRMNLGRKLSADFGRHHSLDVLHDTRNQASIVVEILRAICNLDPGLLADELVVRTFVNVLKAPPLI